MIKKTQLAIFAAMVLSCSVSYGQVFTTINPVADLGLTQGATGINQTFDIGLELGLTNDSAVQLLVSNGNVAASNDLWTVSQSESANFQIVSNTPFDGFIQHGGVLGSQSAQSGTGVSDGFTAAPGQDWTLVSSLDNDYEDTINGNIYDVTYVGADTGNIESNSSAFRWVSDQPISAYTVFTNNSEELVNNYAIGFRNASAIPEPTSTAVIAFASTLLLVRRKRS
jgi:hypothetical protein